MTEISQQRQVVERYFDGFRQTDHEVILSCLTDDVVWDIHGHMHLEGKVAFDGEIENENFVGTLSLVTERFIEQPGTVAALGIGTIVAEGASDHRFAYCTVFTFRDLLVAHVESFVVPLG